eukprot:scaffold204997_cov17-Tisochrysis_lutea.AAC.1
MRMQACKESIVQEEEEFPRLWLRFVLALTQESSIIHLGTFLSSRPDTRRNQRVIGNNIDFSLSTRHIDSHFAKGRPLAYLQVDEDGLRARYVIVETKKQHGAQESLGKSGQN